MQSLDFVSELKEKRYAGLIASLFISLYSVLLCFEKLVSCVVIQQLMLVHRQCFLFKLKDANEHNSFASVYYTICVQTGSNIGQSEGDQNQAFCYNTWTYECIDFEVFSTHFS